jgi:hypothetical protein
MSDNDARRSGISLRANGFPLPLESQEGELHGRNDLAPGLIVLMKLPGSLLAQKN